MAIKYYASDFDRIEDQYFNNSPDIGITKKDVERWIEYIMREENETSP
jgi:lysyl-tRNA synthetase class I